MNNAQFTCVFEMRVVGIGVLGCGTIGRVHAQIIARRAQQARLVAVADVVEGVARDVAAELDVTSVYPSLEKMVSNTEVEAVVIATPNYMHKDNIVEAAEAHKHILCEKPLTLTTQEADQAISAARRAGVKLQVGFMRRYDQGYVKANTLIEQGAIGKPLIFKSISRDSASPLKPGWETDPKLGGGLILTDCTHDFDTARWLMKSEVVSVSAEGGRSPLKSEESFGTA